MKLPTKKQVLEVAESCPEAKVALKKLFPEAFKEEWRDITEACVIERSSDHPGKFCFSLEGELIFWAGIDMLKTYQGKAVKIEDGRIFVRKGE